ncbi:hypothetical protein HBB16_00570 [Pseudonocardia sp. MCCB 268]|nr:hypothetical protein [Pseudonocardia cytotoxica]
MISKIATGPGWTSARSTLRRATRHAPNGPDPARRRQGGCQVLVGLDAVLDDR